MLDILLRRRSQRHLPKLDLTAVVAIAVSMGMIHLIAMVRRKFYLQQQGGPIGLRSTCCIARIVMRWWDRQLTEVMAKSNLTVEEKVRYMDDIRIWIRNIRLGWRWMNDDLVFMESWSHGGEKSRQQG